MYENKLHTKGYGISLTDQCDYNLDAFNILSYRECFSPIYGPAGNGDITNVLNQDYFIKTVIRDTGNLGVHAVCADGGFSVHGNEDFQEHLSLDLYLCQCFMALSILRTGGVFVCKLFDTYTNFSVSLMYLLYACFDEISIYKPVTSRPGNSERYFIGKGFKNIEQTQPICLYLLYIINNRSNGPLYNLELLKWHVLNSDEYFMNYLTTCIYTIENTQINAIKSIFGQLQKISPPKDNLISIEHLMSFWNIHYNTKPTPYYSHSNFKHPNQIFNSLIHPLDGDVILSRFIPTEKNLEWYNIHCSNNSSWNFIKLCDSNIGLKCTLYSCFIKAIIHTYVDGKWVYNNWNINLPVNTIVLGVLVKNTLYILDAIMINGKSVIDLSFKNRQEKIKILIKVVSNISDGKYYNNYINLNHLEFIEDTLSNQIQIPLIITNNQNKFNKNLYLAINEKGLIDRCLFYK